MNRYSLHCTPEQTKKALELGAPITTKIPIECDYELANGELVYPNDIELFDIPTAEEMVGWLEDEIKGSVSIDKSWCSGHRKWIWTIVDDFETVIDSSITFYQSRKEATLAAIDAVLEYLSKNK